MGDLQPSVQILRRITTFVCQKLEMSLAGPVVEGYPIQDFPVRPFFDLGCIRFPVKPEVRQFKAGLKTPDSSSPSSYLLHAESVVGGQMAQRGRIAGGMYAINSEELLRFGPFLASHRRELALNHSVAILLI